MMEPDVFTAAIALTQQLDEKKLRTVTSLAYTAADWQRQHYDIQRGNDERSAAEIDRSRIIHCAAFRRLQGKTQVFGVAHDDFFRTRLTHSLEVAQIAKGIALLVGARVELVEAISLAHDIGHPPFGHAGERTLDACMRERGFGHFESNAQNLRTLTRLEFKKINYPGLNLTRATLDGLLKHKSPHSTGGAPICYESEQELVRWVTQNTSPGETSLETQIVDWADQVAYSVHDLEDGIHAQMITSARLNDPTLKHEIFEQVEPQHPQSLVLETYATLLRDVRHMEEMGDARQRAAARKQLTSLLIHDFVTGVKLKVRRRAGSALNGAHGRYDVKLWIGKPEQGRSAVLKAITRRLIVNDQRVATLERRSTFVIRKLFEELSRKDSVNLYPDEFRGFFSEAADDAERARVACDYIAGMTDSYAEMLYQRLFSPGNGSIFDAL
jgi:dGTPase